MRALSGNTARSSGPPPRGERATAVESSLGVHWRDRLLVTGVAGVDR